MESILITRCAYCRALGAKCRCSKCKSEIYCSRNCQKEHWKVHKLGCKVTRNSVGAKKLAPKVEFTSDELLSVKNRSFKPSVREFEIYGKLGEGNYSTVGIATHIPTGEEFAVKVMDKMKVQRMRYRHKNIDNEVMMERDVLYKLYHPNVVTLYQTFQDIGNLYYLMEKLDGGELWNTILVNDVLVGIFESSAKWYVAQIINGLEYIHGQGLVHRDIKPENVMLTEDGHCRIIDFGTAKNLIETKLNGPEFVGTPEYMSPEVIESKNVGYEADLWSLGSLIYQLIVGNPPFKAGSAYLSFKKALARDFSLPPGFPDVAADLVNQLLVMDPGKRIGSKEQGGYETLKSHAWFKDIDFDNLEISTKPPPTAIEIKAAAICENYIFKGIDYEEPIWKLEPSLLQQVQLYCYRYHQYVKPAVYKHFFKSPADARFIRSWEGSILGLSQNDAGPWDKPFCFTILGSSSVDMGVIQDQNINTTSAVTNTLKLFVEKVNTIKPKFLLCLGDLIAKQINSFQAHVDYFRSTLMAIDENIPIIIVPGVNDTGGSSSQELLKDHKLNFGDVCDGVSYWIQGCCFIVIDSISLSFKGEASSKHMERLRQELYTAKLCGCHVVVFSYYPLFYPNSEGNETTTILEEFRVELISLFHDAMVGLVFFSNASIMRECDNAISVGEIYVPKEKEVGEDEDEIYNGFKMIGLDTIKNEESKNNAAMVSLYRYDIEYKPYSCNAVPDNVILREEESE